MDLDAVLRCEQMMDKYPVRHGVDGKIMYGPSGPRVAGSCGRYVHYPPGMKPLVSYKHCKKYAFFVHVGNNHNYANPTCHLYVSEGVLMYICFENETDEQEYLPSLSQLKKDYRVLTLDEVNADNRPLMMKWLRACTRFRDRWTQQFVPYGIRNIWNNVEKYVGVPLTIFDGTFEDLPIGNFSCCPHAPHNIFLSAYYRVSSPSLSGFVHNEPTVWSQVKLRFGRFRGLTYGKVASTKQAWCRHQLYLLADYRKREKFVGIMKDYNNWPVKRHTIWCGSSLKVGYGPLSNLSITDVAVNHKGWCKLQFRMAEEDNHRLHLRKYLEYTDGELVAAINDFMARTSYHDNRHQMQLLQEHTEIHDTKTSTV
jgi:hypothetical protein